MWRRIVLVVFFAVSMGMIVRSNLSDTQEVFKCSPKYVYESMCNPVANRVDKLLRSNKCLFIRNLGIKHLREGTCSGYIDSLLLPLDTRIVNYSVMILVYSEMGTIESINSECISNLNKYKQRIILSRGNRSISQIKTVISKSEEYRQTYLEKNKRTIAYLKEIIRLFLYYLYREEMKKEETNHSSIYNHMVYSIGLTKENRRIVIVELLDLIYSIETGCREIDMVLLDKRISESTILVKDININEVTNWIDRIDSELLPEYLDRDSSMNELVSILKRACSDSTGLFKKEELTVSLSDLNASIRLFSALSNLYDLVYAMTSYSEIWASSLVVSCEPNKKEKRAPSVHINYNGKEKISTLTDAVMSAIIESVDTNEIDELPDERIEILPNCIDEYSNDLSQIIQSY